MPHCAFYTVGCWRIISEAANLTTNPKLASLSLSLAPCLPLSLPQWLCLVSAAKKEKSGGRVLTIRTIKILWWLVMWLRIDYTPEVRPRRLLGSAAGNRLGEKGEGGGGGAPHAWLKFSLAASQSLSESNWGGNRRRIALLASLSISFLPFLVIYSSLSLSLSLSLLSVSLSMHLYLCLRVFNIIWLLIYVWFLISDLCVRSELQPHSKGGCAGAGEGLYNWAASITDDDDDDDI